MKAVIIDTGYACFGVFFESESGIIKEAPPIAKWCIGKNIDEVIYYYKNKKEALIVWV